jgi:glucokinase
MSRPHAALVADIGGTWTRFAIAVAHPDAAPTLHALRQLPVAAYPSLLAAARDYLEGLDPSLPAARNAVLAVAGRVLCNRAAMTNHPWLIDGEECAAALDLEQVALVNDFTAQALCVPFLLPAEQVQLGGRNKASAPADPATYAVLGPGTGLGVSALLCRHGREFALESEGGHAAFAPKTERQRALLAQLAQRYPRVSYERLLSGAGLCNLHWGLSRIEGVKAPEPLLPEQVTTRGRAGEPLCAAALELFCEVFGAFAGDLVLTFGSWNGVYLSGGLVPLLIDELQQPHFRSAFENKGRFADAMREVPVYAVMHPQAGLLGAAAMALRRTAGAVGAGGIASLAATTS